MVWIETPALGESRRPQQIPRPKATALLLDSTAAATRENDKRRRFTCLQRYLRDAILAHRIRPTNGIRMCYAESGSGPIVLMCHGFPESWYFWRHQITALAEAGFRAVAPDRCFRRSEICPPRRRGRSF